MKKFFYLAVVCCLVLTGMVFSSCEKKENVSSYQFGYTIDPSTAVDPAVLAQFELDEQGMPLIYKEMKKTADQSSDAARTCIWKATRQKAIESAKQAFAAGMEAVRKDAGSYKGIVIRLYMDDPDTNAPVEIQKATI
jgi:hypothetical protein